MAIRRPDPRPPGERTSATRSRRSGTPGSRPATGSSCRPTCGSRRPAAGTPERFPAILEMIPYGKDNWRRNADIGARDVSRRARLRPVPGRRPRDRIVRRRRPRRVHRGGDARRLRRGRVARRPAVVRRRGRDVGHQLRRVHLDPGREAAAAAPARDRPGQATDDRYLSDVHYIGGCVTASELSQYAVSQVAMNAMPPDPAFRGAGWRGSGWRGSRRRRRG